MNYIKNTILIFIIVLLNACATSSDQATPQKSTIKNQDSKESLVSIENESDQLLQIFDGTKLKGAVLDTAYGAIEDAKIYTSPATVEVRSDEEGNFELISDKFYSDISYIIYFTHQDYFNDQKTGYYPEIDSTNDLGYRFLVPKKIIDFETRALTPKVEDSGIELKE